jgi:multiple sugar transport system permease protein
MTRQQVAYLLLAPAAILVALFIIAPVVVLMLLSFTDWQLGSSTLRIVGLGNYQQLAADPGARISLRNTALYVALVVPTSTVLALLAALAIRGAGKLAAFYRTAFFLPVTTTVVAMALAWEFLLHPSFGLVNLLLAELGVRGPVWLRDPGTVLYALAAIGVWLKFGYYVVLFLAGLSTLPKDLYDAAEVDGIVGAFDRFRYITWPLLGPTVLFVVIIATIQTFQVFEIVATLTQGRPGRASEVLLFTIFQEGFVYFRTGYASALTVVFLFLILALVLVKFRYFDRRVHYA